MFGRAAEVELDTIGRILIPDVLKDRIKLKDKAVIVGVQDRVEVWNEDAWNKCEEGFEKEADRLAESLGTK